MRTGRNQTKVCDLLVTLTKSDALRTAGDIALAADMNHESVLAWLYKLRDAGLVECLNEVPRKWRWK